MMGWLKRIWTWLTGPHDEAVVPQDVVPEAAPVVPVPVIAGEPDSDQGSSVVTKRLRQIRNRIADAADDILVRFEKLDITSVQSGAEAGDCTEALSYLMGCDFHYIDELAEDLSGGDRWFLQDEAAEMVRTEWPIDIGLVVRKEGYYLLSRTFTVTPKEVRGKIKMASTKMLTLVAGHFYDDGAWWAESTILGLIGGRWESVEPESVVTRQTSRGTLMRHRPNSKKMRDERDSAANQAISAALTARYSWHVAFGKEDGPRLLLPTNPSGCLELFKTREKTPGQTRRAALRHWVQNHYRNAPEGVAYVRDHLRGVTRFLWRDWPTELLVSAFDLEKNEFFRQQVAEWRAQRKHNRVRVRLKRRV